MTRANRIPMCPTCDSPCTGNPEDGFSTLADSDGAERLFTLTRIASALENIWEEIRAANRAKGVYPE